MNFFKSKINASEAALTELQVSFASLQKELASVKAELVSAQESASTYLSEFTRCDALNKEQAATIEALNVSLAEASRDAAEFDSKVALAAVREVASMGHPEPLSIVEEQEPAQDLLKTFKNLRGNELVKFYQSNKKEIERSLRAS